MFYMRVDANQAVASGHVVRCLSIADELRELGIETTFVTNDYGTDAFVNERNYKLIHLNSNWNDPESEIDEMTELVAQREIKAILVDSYNVTERYIKELSGITKVIFLDDLGSITTPVARLINYNIFAKDLNYADKINMPTENVLLGSKFAPLRKEFRDIENVFKKDVKRIFISTGGTDTYNVSGKLLECLRLDSRFFDFEFHVISGKMNFNYNKLSEWAEESSNVYLYSDVKRMSEIMQRCDLAVSGCGSTMYELCRCGLPIITFALAENQKLATCAFQRYGVAIDCGDIENGVENLVERVGEEIYNLSENVEIRRAMHNKAVNVVDGLGAWRIGREICKMIECGE